MARTLFYVRNFQLFILSGSTVTISLLATAANYSSDTYGEYGSFMLHRTERQSFCVYSWRVEFYEFPYSNTDSQDKGENN